MTRVRRMAAAVFLGFLVPSPGRGADGEDVVKQSSAFYPPEVLARAQANAKRFKWAARIRDGVVEAAGPWRRMSDEALWRLMFGNTIKRSWMVWSNGHCPACRASVPMYTWEIDPLTRPWKVRCPHCEEVFPKNDFRAFYESGLDEHGIFDPKRANRDLLFNAEHPGAKDPLRTFGVDDGEGFRQGRRRWRFIGAYLIYGQWKGLIVRGAEALSNAYAVTGDPVYAHKAGILLDRVADLYPTFDFQREGVLYEGPGAAGYVSTWHDACEETRELVLAYDRIFDGIKADGDLVDFLKGKATRHKLANPKESFADIQRNVESGLILDVFRNKRKIKSNEPRTEVALAVLTAVLGRPGSPGSAYNQVRRIVARSTRVDGVTGEKGMAGYATIGPRSLATILERCATADPAFIADCLKRYPHLHQTYRFHIDTHCLDAYYPSCGDSGAFAQRAERYCGADFRTGASVEPSAFSFLWRLYKETGDADFARVIYRANGGSTRDVPHDVFAADPSAMQRALAAVLKEQGPQIRRGSVNKRQWRLALLRSGKGNSRRVLWLDYDSGCGRHSHRDGMNLGLYALGLDLLPDFGYPPVQFGGWGSSRARWYTQTAAHNTVLVDGRDLANAPGKTTLWAEGEWFRAVRASGPRMIGGKQYERTAALVDASDTAAYVLDVFRVVGGADHVRLLTTHFGAMTTRGVTLKATPRYKRAGPMKDYMSDPAAKPGWSVDVKIEDRHGYLPKGAEPHLRITDLTAGAEAATARVWVAPGGFNRSDEAWVPRVLVRRTGTAPLASTFVSVIEPYGRHPTIAAVKRLALTTVKGAPLSDADVAVEVQLADGRRDLVTAIDAEHPLKPGPRHRVTVQPDWGLRYDGEMAFVRRSKEGRVGRVALCAGRTIEVGDVTLTMREKTPFVAVRFAEDGPVVVGGNRSLVESITVGGRRVGSP